MSTQLSSALQTVPGATARIRCVSDEPRREEWWLDDNGRWIAPDAQSPSLRSEDPAADPGAAHLRAPMWTDAEDVPADPPTAEEGSTRRILIAAAALLAVVLAVGVVAAVTSRGGRSAAATTTTTTADATTTKTTVDSSNSDVPGTPGPVQVVGHQIDSTHAQFTWTYTNSLPTDTFMWRSSDGRQFDTTSAPSVMVPNQAGRQQCLEVRVLRAGAVIWAGDPSAVWSRVGCLTDKADAPFGAGG